MLAKHYLSFFVGWGGGLEKKLQCCSYYQLLNDLSSKSSMTIFHHRFVQMQNYTKSLHTTNNNEKFVRVEAEPIKERVTKQQGCGQWMDLKFSSTIHDNKFVYKKCHLKSYHIDVKCHVTLNTFISGRHLEILKPNVTLGNKAMHYQDCGAQNTLPT